jgi:Tol biopolymer transport system component
MILPLTADMRAAGPPQPVRLAGFRAEACGNPRWLADGRSLVFTFNRGGASRLWRVRLPDDLAQEVTPELIPAGDGIESAALSARARRLVFTQTRGDANLWRVPLEGGGLPQKWVASSRNDSQADLRADGRIVFESDRSGFLEVWVTEPDGTGARALTDFRGPMAGSPRWAPDGRTIAFDSRRDGKPHIYAMDVPGPGQPFPPGPPPVRRVTRSGEQNVVPAWSPDGKWIYFQSPRAGGDRICRVPAAGGEEQIISPGFARSPVLSPDGRWVYYARLGDYWRCPAAGGPEELVAKRVVIRSMVPVPGGLWFLRTDTRETQIVFRDEKTGAERIAARYGGRAEPGLALSPDRKYAIVTRRQEGQADLMLVENFDPR